ncbi:MAG TPA: hypothetical protein VGJ66_00725 [Pyrinomonadaceae bacterium]
MSKTFKNDSLTPPATAPMPPVCGPVEKIAPHNEPKLADISGYKA